MLSAVFGVIRDNAGLGNETNMFPKAVTLTVSEVLQCAHSQEF
jgi:hypothetical protein